MSRYHTLLLVLAALVAPTAGLVLRDVDQTEAGTTPDDTGAQLQKMIDDYFVEMGWQAPSWYERPDGAAPAPYTTTTKPPTIEDVAHLFLEKVKRLRQLSLAMVFLCDVGNYANTIFEAIKSIKSDTASKTSEWRSAGEDLTKVVDAFKAEHGALNEALFKASHTVEELTLGLKAANMSYSALKALATKLPFLIPDAGEKLQKSEQELMEIKAALSKAELVMSEQLAKLDESESDYKAAISTLPTVEVGVLVSQKIHETVSGIFDLVSSIYPAFTDALEMKKAEKLVQIFNQINEVIQVRDVDFNKTVIDPQLQSKIEIQGKKSKMIHR